MKEALRESPKGFFRSEKSGEVYGIDLAVIDKSRVSQMK